jgi:hypothetical protein
MPRPLTPGTSTQTPMQSPLGTPVQASAPLGQSSRPSPNQAPQTQSQPGVQRPTQVTPMSGALAAFAPRGTSSAMFGAPIGVATTASAFAPSSAPMAGGRGPGTDPNASDNGRVVGNVGAAPASSTTVLGAQSGEGVAVSGIQQDDGQAPPPSQGYVSPFNSQNQPTTPGAQSANQGNANTQDPNAWASDNMAIRAELESMENRRFIQNMVAEKFRVDEAGVTDGEGNYRTWAQIAAGDIPAEGDEDVQQAWANAMSFGRTIRDKLNSGLADKQRQATLAGIDEWMSQKTPTMSEEEKNNIRNQSAAAMRAQLSETQRAMMQVGGFGSAEAAAGNMGQMFTSGAITQQQQRAQQDMTFAMQDLQARIADSERRMAGLSMKLQLTMSDEERTRTLRMMEDERAAQASYSQRIAAYSRELNRPTAGEVIGGTFLGKAAGAAGDLAAAPLKAAGSYVGSALGGLPF